MSGGGNLCKVIVLLLPATITVGLLSFCLISDWWIGVDEIKLNNFKQVQEKAFHIYLHGSDNEQAKSQTTITTTTTTIITTVTTTTTAKISTKKTNDDLIDDYGGNGGENLYDDVNVNSNNNETLNYDAENEQDQEQDMKKLKRKKRSSSSGRSQKNDFVFITKLWPMIKSKSLYSECIRYEKLTLRMSLSYLNLSNKEPIVGTIYYGNALTNRSGFGNNEQCTGRVGMISCLLSNECVQGTICDGIVDCDDNTDEQFCDASQVCHTANGGFQCDNKCWQYWHKCDQTPHCLNLSDELSNACAIQHEKQSATRSFFTPDTFIFGLNQYDYRHKCFRSYFNFKSPKLVEKDNLKYLTQSFTDKLQATNVMNYHLHLIYAMALLFAFVFSVLALVSLLFMVCLQKSCIQCPFWFYGFFEILTWLSCSFGLMTFLAHKAYANNPVNFPFEREIFAENKNFPDFQIVGVTFWIAVAANGVSFLASVISCIFCCRLPSPRHENKEYKIMQLPTYN